MNIEMTLYAAIARSVGNKAVTHLDDGTEVIVHELTFLRPLKSPDDPGSVIRLYDVIHITYTNEMRWNSCTESEMMHTLAPFGIQSALEKRWSPV